MSGTEIGHILPPYAMSGTEIGHAATWCAAVPALQQQGSTPLHAVSCYGFATLFAVSCYGFTTLFDVSCYGFATLFAMLTWRSAVLRSRVDAECGTEIAYGCGV
eukprot:892622-Rhodomonas_salina.1